LYKPTGGWERSTATLNTVVKRKTLSQMEIERWPEHVLVSDFRNVTAQCNPQL